MIYGDLILRIPPSPSENGGTADILDSAIKWVEEQIESDHLPVTLRVVNGGGPVTDSYLSIEIDEYEIRDLEKNKFDHEDLWSKLADLKRRYEEEFLRRRGR